MNNNNTSLINRTRTKRRCLMIANETFVTDALPDTRVDADGKTWTYTRAREAHSGKRFTQVSQELLQELDTEFRKLVYQRVTKQIQTGKTVR